MLIKLKGNNLTVYDGAVLYDSIKPIDSTNKEYLVVGNKEVFFHTVTNIVLERTKNTLSSKNGIYYSSNIYSSIDSSEKKLIYFPLGELKSCNRRIVSNIKYGDTTVYFDRNIKEHKCNVIPFRNSSQETFVYKNDKVPIKIVYLEDDIITMTNYFFEVDGLKEDEFVYDSLNRQFLDNPKNFIYHKIPKKLTFNSAYQHISQ
jgi:hypothetical protein